MSHETFWPMQMKNGPYDEAREVFKCRGCGAVTEPRNGWNGEPDPSMCSDRCHVHASKWRRPASSQRYRENFVEIFPDTPGAGI
jgi:hypothetical protein